MKTKKSIKAISLTKLTLKTQLQAGQPSQEAQSKR
jgi:hypothetical protein